MLGVTGFGLILTPLFYVLVRKLWPRALVLQKTAIGAPTILDRSPFINQGLS
jgi:hypothetical protein